MFKKLCLVLCLVLSLLVGGAAMAVDTPIPPPVEEECAIIKATSKIFRYIPGRGLYPFKVNLDLELRVGVDIPADLAADLNAKTKELGVMDTTWDDANFAIVIKDGAMIVVRDEDRKPCE